MRTVINSLAGLIFGLGLLISGMANPAKVQNFLDLAGTFDPSLIFVMVGAIVVTFLSYRFAFQRPRPILAERFSLARRRTGRRAGARRVPASSSGGGGHVPPGAPASRAMPNGCRVRGRHRRAGMELGSVARRRHKPPTSRTSASRSTLRPVEPDAVLRSDHRASAIPPAKLTVVKPGETRRPTCACCMTGVRHHLPLDPRAARTGRSARTSRCPSPRSSSPTGAQNADGRLPPPAVRWLGPDQQAAVRGPGLLQPLRCRLTAHIAVKLTPALPSTALAVPVGRGGGRGMSASAFATSTRRRGVGDVPRRAPRRTRRRGRRPSRRARRSRRPARRSPACADPPRRARRRPDWS